MKAASYPVVWNSQAAQNPPVQAPAAMTSANVQYAITSAHTVANVSMLDGSVRSISTNVSQGNGQPRHVSE